MIGPNEIHLPRSHPTRETNRRNDIDADHVRNFLDAVKCRKDPIEPVEVGHSTASLCILGNIAQLLKRKFTWDPAAERSTDDEVNRMLQRPMREPWKLRNLQRRGLRSFFCNAGGDSSDEGPAATGIVRLEPRSVFFGSVARPVGWYGTAAPNDARPRVITPNEFEGTDVERINLAIAAAAEAGCRVVIPAITCAANSGAMSG